MVEETTMAGNKLKRFFSFYSEDEFAQILKCNDFTLLDVSTKEKKGVTWLGYIVQKN